MAVTDVIAELMRKAERANPKAPGDVFDPQTGALLCGVCHTPKTAVISLLGTPVTVHVLCRCAKERAEAEETQRKKREFADKVAENRRICFGSGSRKAGYTFDLDNGKNPETMRLARGYAAQFADYYRQGKGLLLLGPTGTGKTFAACCIANALLDRGYTALVTTFADVAARLQSGYDKSAVYGEIGRCDLLIVDDFGAERETSFMDEVVFTVVDSRLSSDKPLVVTSNLSAEDIMAEGVPIAKRRVFSRLYEACVPVEVTGPDQRRERMQRQTAAQVQRLRDTGGIYGKNQ